MIRIVNGRILFSLVVLFGVIFTFRMDGQELPPVSVFSSEDYLADNQNWSISQDSHGHIFVANNKGLLEYDGMDWRLYPSPNESIIRAVYCHRDTVFTGCYRDFGYWVRNSEGMHQYTSLVKNRDWEMGEDEQIWKILEFENHFIFQSLSTVYIYDPISNSMESFNEEGGITRVFRQRNELYVSVPNQGIYQLDKNGLSLISKASVFMDNLIVGMYDINGEIFVQTNTGGVASLKEPDKFWASSFFEKFGEMKVYSSHQSEDGTIYIGTVSKGVFSLTEQGFLDYRMSRRNSLSNNTILNIFEDINQNIWLALDNGVNVIHKASPMRIYYDDSGDLGTVYNSIIFNNNLYLGTNQGLFYKKLDDTKSNSFKLVSGSIGQVWTLYEFDGTLFVGHDQGTFLVRNDSMQLVDKYAGSWCFRSVPGDSSRLLVGQYKGMSILSKLPGGWEVSSRFGNYDFSSRYVEFVSDSLLLVNHEYKGVYKLEVQMNPGMEKVLSIDKDTTLERGVYSSLSGIGDKVYYAYEGGVFFYQPEQDTFLRDSLLSRALLEGGYSSGKVLPGRDNYGAWLFSASGIHWVRPGKIKEEKEVIFLPIPAHQRNAMLGYENILQIGFGKFLFGHAGGYFVFDIDKYREIEFSMPLRFRSVVASNLEGDQNKMSLRERNVDLDPDFNSVFFRFSMPRYEDYFLSEYQYRLKGYNTSWSSWQTQNTFEVNNLSYGEYTFEVRGRIGEKNVTPIISYRFSISRPIWLSMGMIFVYILLGVGLIIFIHYKYKSYYENEKKKELRKTQRKQDLKESENKRKFIRLQNEKLQQEIESKNRELAISTMGLIKKNRFLNKIKKELKKADSNQASVGKVINVIDNNLRSSDDWKFFEQAFNDADKDFFKKMKKKHPVLTNNDLRFCAYLRLNLSSKEVAPLLSISPKSVEVKRYRLRKKMGLDGDTNLTEYILSI